MKITRQEPTADRKLWNPNNLPKTPFVLIVPSGGSSEGTDIEYLVIPQKDSREGRYQLICLFTSTRIDSDSSNLATQMNLVGTLAVEAVISGRTSFFADGKKNMPIFSEDFLQVSSISLIKSKVGGYCLVMTDTNVPHDKDYVHRIIPLNGTTSWNASAETIYVGVKNGAYELVEDSEISISDVRVLPQSH